MILIARLRPNCVYSSATAHLLPRPSPFEPDCSSPTSTRPFRAQLLVSHPLCLFEHNHSSPASAKSLRARLLVSHLHQALSSPATCLLPNRVNPSATARLPPPPGPFEPGYLSPTQPCLFERNRSSPASTKSLRARLLVSRLHQTLSSPATCLPPNCVNSSATAHVPPPTRSL